MRDWLHDAFFVLNGDTIFDAPLPRLAGLLMSYGASGAVALRGVEDASRYGSVILQDDRIASFGEKTASGPGLINGGIYAFRRWVIDRLGSPSSIETDLLPALAEEGDLVGLPSDGFFIDIGLPETFADAQRSVPAWWSSRAASGAAGAT
jgi:NDP-sugar pyrophosphorylase family protein